MEEPWELAKLPTSLGKPFAPSAHKNEDRVIVSCPKRVDVYSLPESKCVESWSLDRTGRLSSSGQQSDKSGNYFIAHDGGIVYQWDETAACHADWMRHDVHDEVMAIHMFEDVTEDALVVTETGAAQWVSAKKEETPQSRRKHKRSASKVPYQWSGVWQSKFHRKRAAVICNEGDSSKLKLSILCVNSGESPYVITSRTICPPTDSTVVDCCLLREYSPFLVLLFSNGQVAQFNIDADEEVLSLSSEALAGCFSCKCDASKCCLTAVDDCHVAIVGTQECCGKGMEAGASIWNMAYSTRVACQSLRHAATTEQVHAVMLQSCLVVILDQRVVVVPCRPLSKALSCVVGCGSSIQTFAGEDRNPIVSIGEWTSQNAMEQDTPPTEDGSRHQTLQECLNDEKSLSRDVVERLLRSGHVSGGIVRQLVERLQVANDYHLLSACLRYVPDISEAVLVSVLSTYVQCLGKTKPSKLLFRQVQGYLDLALACQYNPMHLRDELRQLPIGVALKLIQLLSTRLSHGYALSDECKKDLSTAEICCLLTWLSLVLDSQATRLLLDTEARSVLKEVNASVRQHLKVSFQLLRLTGPLAGVKQKSVVHSRRAVSKHYQIEVLHI